MTRTSQKTDKAERLEWIQRRRENHHKALEILAKQVGCNTDGLTLWRKLRRLENQTYKQSLAFCNGDIDTDQWSEVSALAKMKVAIIFAGKMPVGVRINGDARGHALKLDSDKVTIPEGMERDWGGDGILAAEID